MKRRRIEGVDVPVTTLSIWILLGTGMIDSIGGENDVHTEPELGNKVVILS